VHLHSSAPVLLINRINRCLPWLCRLWETALAAATSTSSSSPQWNEWWWGWSWRCGCCCSWSCQSRRRSAAAARRRASAAALHQASSVPPSWPFTGPSPPGWGRSLRPPPPPAGHLHGGLLHHQLGAKGRKSRGCGGFETATAEEGQGLRRI